MEIIIIAAVAENNVIGKAGKLPWHLPEDLKHFKKLTMSYPIIMGRRTFESIGKPLPGRRNIVITHNIDFAAEGADVFHSFEAALDSCTDDKVFIIGGFSLFKEALEFADKIEMTKIHKKVDGDVLFPEVNWNEWEELSREDHREYSFISYKRR